MRSSLTARSKTARSTTVGLALLLLLAACSEQEPEVVINEQVPADQVVVEHAEGEEGAEEPAGEPDAVWTAEQLAYTSTPSSMPAGGALIALEIVGGVPHNVVFEGFEGDRILVEGNAEGITTETVDVPAGEYTFYCSISGHRAAGMEGTITVG